MRYTQLSLVYSNLLPFFIGTAMPYFIFSLAWNNSLGIVRITDGSTHVLKCWTHHTQALNVQLEFSKECHGDVEFQGNLVQPPVRASLFLLLVCSVTSPPRYEPLSIFFVSLGRMSMPSSSSTARHWAGSLPWASHRVQLRSWSPWRGKSVGNWSGSLLTWRKNKGVLPPAKENTLLSPFWGGQQFLSALFRDLLS